ncbi:unnamed protein product, partial [Mesorhabditis belari]|uniref:YEATS domain-containing protein n=1 Tax=Mesorhabditis belari TaxID=2138241 RepID=A0AAF3FLG6_9BILA
MTVTLVKLKVGHASERLTKKNAAGHDYRWRVFVKPVTGDQFADRSLIHKVIFNLHTSFDNPTRVIKQPPFEVTETGYGSFTMQIIIILANDKKKEYPIQYELLLTNDIHYQSSNIQKIGIQTPTSAEFQMAIKRYCGEAPSSQRSSDASPESKESKIKSSNLSLSTSSLFDSNQTSSSSSSSQSSNSSDSSDSEGEKKRKLLKKKTKEMQKDEPKSKFNRPKDAPKSMKKKIAMKDQQIKNSPTSSTTTSVTPASTPGTSSTSKDPRATPTTPENRSVKTETSLTPPMKNGGLRLSEKVNGKEEDGKTREELERSVGKRLKGLQNGSVDSQSLFDIALLLVREGSAKLNGTSLEYDLTTYSLTSLQKIYHRLRKVNVKMII